MAAATTSVEDMNDSDFMTLGRWLMTNTKDMEVRTGCGYAASQRARLAGMLWWWYESTATLWWWYESTAELLRAYIWLPNHAALQASAFTGR